MKLTIEKFRESGNLIDSFSSADNSADLVKDAELFTVGTHRGRDYTIKDLETLAGSFNKEDMVPIQLDHSESARDTVGFLESVKVVGDKLMGTVRIIEESIKQRVQKGLAKKVSISFYTDSQGNPSKIREVSLVAFPQVKSAQLFREQALEDSLFEHEYQQYVKSLGIK
ncbi:hypothetical protein [Bacillus pseudomycoides]|uniref:hypothetical protein n=1 Tax=Bacillus pseudomycoides TaxID=64104 RepID=UPI000BF93353|nr:hypothetical protein [Bacillus pseudomycoides]PGC41914.1 hypothetical protein COM18_09675 [Bacillus pseudomycoides]